MKRQVTILFDLETRDGRKAVEIYEATQSGGCKFRKQPIYSCAYDTQAGRILALRRAGLFCDHRARHVVQFLKAEKRSAILI